MCRITKKDIIQILEDVKKRYYELVPGSCSHKQFVGHLQSLGFWNKPRDYPEMDESKIKFPETIHIVYAVCHKGCGRAEFIVESRDTYRNPN